MEDEKNYLAHYGIKGMKWGVRRSSKELRNAAASRQAAKPAEKKPAATATSSSSTSSKTPKVETSAERYIRLKDQAAKKGANSLSDDDLRFVNNRAEAMAKINKLNTRKPGWVQEAAKDAAKRAAQKSMQDLATATVEKYITDKVAAKYNLPTATEKQKSKAAKKTKK